MGRQLPVECEHGVVYDYGDFGPDPEDGTAGTEECPQCADRASRTAHIDVEWGKGSDVPDGVIRDTIENACDHLMAQLVLMGVTDPDIGATLVGRQCTILHRDDLAEDTE